jgi:GNAT superfamily N-acetyltransferase
MTIEIRAIAAADKAQWIPLWRGYQAFYKTEIAEAVSDVTWNRLLDPAEPMMGAAIAWDADKAIGLVHHIQHRSCWTTGDYCYLQDLFVAADARGHGVGRKLIEYVYGYSKSKGCSRVHWLTHESNTDAMELYNKIASRSGFIQYRQLL